MKDLSHIFCLSNDWLVNLSSIILYSNLWSDAIQSDITLYWSDMMQSKICQSPFQSLDPLRLVPSLGYLQFKIFQIYRVQNPESVHWSWVVADHGLRKRIFSPAHLVSRASMSTMEPLAFYTQQKTHMTSSRSCMQRQSEAPWFLYVVMCMLKVVKPERFIDWEYLAFVDTLVHWSCMRSCVSPLCRSGRAPLNLSVCRNASRFVQFLGSRFESRSSIV
jgi:hypothetical protein